MYLGAFVMAYFISVSTGYNFFEGFVRVNCYHDKQPGCNTEFIEKYPEVAHSANNSTVKADTYFFMFAKGNKDIPELMHKCGGGLPPNTKFNKDCRTEIFIPGFVSSPCNYAIFRELKDERLKSGCYNVILVEWMWGNNFDLLQAKNNGEVVARQLAIVIDILKETYELGPEHFILTGHSYGAHIAGLTGQLTPVSIINGVEPAGVLYYEEMPLNERLDAGDAQCVQVLHTSAGQCLWDYFGVNFTCGDIDVYYNGGLHQPACRPQQIKAFMKGDYVYAYFSFLPAACNHFQALQYYKASINPSGCPQTAVQCDKGVEGFNAGDCRDCGTDGKQCLNVGAYGCDCFLANRTPSPAKYYLNTTLECPFCDNENIINADKAVCGSR